MTEETTAREQRDMERLALAIVETCVRNTGLETLHAGTFPRSATGAWDRPRQNTDLMKTVRRRQAGRNIGEPDPDPT